MPQFVGNNTRLYARVTFGVVKIRMLCTVSCHVLIRSCEQQTLDANRSFARELARNFSARMGKALWLVFPDDAEVKKQAPPTDLTSQDSSLASYGHGPLLAGPSLQWHTFFHVGTMRRWSNRRSISRHTKEPINFRHTGVHGATVGLSSPRI